MRVAMLAIDGAFDSGLATVADVLETANVLRDEIERPPPPWEVTVVGTRRQVRTAAGMRVTTTSVEELDAPPQLLVAPALGVRQSAAVVETVGAARNRPLLDLLARCRSEGIELAGACTGAFFLAESGVLEEQPATTSWWLGPTFRARYPGVDLDTGQTLVRGEGVSTAGAAFAHIDLALSLVHTQSPALADLIARYLLIGDRASQASFAVPTMLARNSPEMATFERWVRSHLDGPIRISAAAAAIGLSERTLQRVTAATVGMSPVEFVNEVRLDEAAFLLRSSTLTADAVAARVGFQNAGTLRALVRRRRGMTIRELRRGATRA
ncbi:GlxA family transcriptional regulator [Pseudonocardia acidicola]|uniref:Helix-turn-helix domain-containing protein n=1 Tax=Pseudonocardia acidicola TaxID=2724939 RepID=A0ABX1SPB6_9PSEU|nr:helix-turn-helix domain-containing protein [Pseudonocardia acidicola]NMI01984.1 helix-turn-helix domain-containing protein [Pseudonocardia acidicola]